MTTFDFVDEREHDKDRIPGPFPASVGRLSYFLNH